MSTYRLGIVATHDDGTATSHSWAISEWLAADLVRIYLGPPHTERVLDAAYLAQLRQLGVHIGETS